MENRYAYDAFGNLLGQEEAFPNRILYAGQLYDQKTDQYYLRARYYNPTIGRFSQEDTYWGDGLNLYAYCANNPVRYFDPSGHQKKPNCPGTEGEAATDKQPGVEIETSYGKSTLNSLKNTENFTDSAIEHIFEGQVNARGKAVGYHYEGIEGTSGNVIPGTESSVNNIGVYKAQVEVNGIPKTANGGFSTFYSKNLSPQQVVDAINEAYSNCELKLGTRNTYQGVANNGMKIDMFLDQSGKIISAFPEE